MPRPKIIRYVSPNLPQMTFAPEGLPSDEIVTITHDELEAIHLADLDGLYHEQAASELNVSRATFGRIVGIARGKVADALINGKKLVIVPGDPKIVHHRETYCKQHGTKSDIQNEKDA